MDQTQALYPYHVVVTGSGRYMVHNKTDKFFNTLFAAVVAFEVLFLIWLNIFHIHDGVDQDFSKLLRHVYEMAVNRTLFLPNWNYLTTGEQDCAALPAVFFCLLTGNVYCAYALANIFNVFLWLFIISRLLCAVSLSLRSRLLCYGFVFLSYDFGMLQYTNMMFYCGGQYVYKALLPVLFVTLMLRDGGRRSISAVLYLLYFTLLLISGISSGVYVFICGIFPALCAALFIELSTTPQYTKKTQLYKTLFLGCASLLLTAAGVLLCHKMNINPSSSSIVLADFDHDCIDTILSCLESVLALLHPSYSDISIKSFQGIAICLNWLILVFILFGLASVREFTQLHKLIGNKVSFHPGLFCKSKARFILISISLWNFAVVSLTVDSERYHLIGVIPLMICSAMILEDFLSAYNTAIQRLFYLVVFSSVLMLSVYNAKFRVAEYCSADSVNDNSGTRWNEGQLYYVAEMLEQQDVDVCIVLNYPELSERMRSYDFAHQYYSYYTKEQTVAAADYYDKDAAELFNCEHVIIGTEEEFDSLPAKMQSRYISTGTDVLGHSVWRTK